jgi:hypothetical protein
MVKTFSFGLFFSVSKLTILVSISTKSPLIKSAFLEGFFLFSPQDKKPSYIFLWTGIRMVPYYNEVLGSGLWIDEPIRPQSQMESFGNHTYLGHSKLP